MLFFYFFLFIYFFFIYLFIIIFFLNWSLVLNIEVFQIAKVFLKIKSLKKKKKKKC